MTTSARAHYTGYRFPAEIIGHVVWLYLVHVPEVATRPDQLIARAAFDAGLRALLTVPLRKGDVLLAYISAGRPEVGPFTDKQIAQLQNFADQAVIAMENARLINETREALEQQTATAEVLQVINSSPGDLAPVFDAILEKAHALCGAAAGALLISEGEEYRVAAVHGEARLTDYWGRQKPWPLPPRDERTPLPRLIRGERLINLADAKDDDGYRDSERYRNLIDLSGARALLAVPLRKDDAVLGVITAFRHEIRPFSEREVAPQMTHRWREVDSNHRSPSRDCRRSERFAQRS